MKWKNGEGGNYMTDIYVYCHICNEEDGKEVLAKKAVLVNGTMVFYLMCGHTVTEKFSA